MKHTRIVQDHRMLIRQVKIGSLVPIYTILHEAIDPVSYFAKLSRHGRKPHSLLLESADIVPTYGRYSIGSADPCLKLSGKGDSFTLEALNSLGEKFLHFIRKEFGFCSGLEISEKKITGILAPEKKEVSEYERLQLRSPMDIIRKVSFAFQPVLRPFRAYGGLFGAFSYDFIDQVESLPSEQEELVATDNYVFYFLDNLFFVDHKNNKTYFVANALKTEDDADNLVIRCKDKIDHYLSVMKQPLSETSNPAHLKQSISSDMSKRDFIKKTKAIKEHINKGEIFQAVLSRTLVVPYTRHELDIYSSLKKLNPSPYMFYINFGSCVLLGASPEMNLRVQEEDGKMKTEIRPIAGTRPRGLVNKKIDDGLDSCYEIAVRTDEKELAEHTMLVDLGRNDIAKISLPGTRKLEACFSVEKYSHVQHLVSSVTGQLRPELDCLHAYLATMNMGTLTGAPKIRAMELLRRYEPTKRGYYGGAVGYITPHKEMDSCIVIRSMVLQENKAYVRAGGGIVYDSDPEQEFMETEKKAAACLRAIEGDADD